jgi:hypothetical protein
VGHDSDVADRLEWDGSRHVVLPAVVGESLVGFRHLVDVLTTLHS